MRAATLSSTLSFVKYKFEEPSDNASVSASTVPPNAVEAPAIVIVELANFAFVIEPANIAFVIPNALTLNESEFVSIELSSTLTANAPLDALSPSPAIAVARSAMDSFLLAVPSIIGILSADTSTEAAVNSFKSNASDTVPDVPPPDKPSPAVTPAISPLSSRRYTELPIPL